AGAELALQALFKVSHARRLGGGAALGLAARGLLLGASDELFGLTDAEAAPDDLLGEVVHLRSVRHSEQSAGVPLGELTLDELGAHEIGQAQEAQRVGDGGAILADLLGERVLAVAVLLHQSIEGLRELDGVQILALDVLDERELE